MQHNNNNNNNNNQITNIPSINISSATTTSSSQQQLNDILKIKRGFKLTHQKLALDIDIDKKSIEGYTEIIIQPQTRRLRVDKIRLNCRQCFVTKCEVNQVETPFLMKNFLETIVSNPEIRDIDTYQAFTKAALHSSDEGELFIDVPPSVQFYEGVQITEQQQQRNIVQFSPLVIKIHFRLVNPISSLQFILPDKESYPLRKPHMFTYNQADGARMWFPSVDQINEKCTWELDLTANSNLVVVATGQLLEKVCNEDETKNTFIYRQETPTSANAIGFCVGPFEIYPDPYLPNVTHFCLPHKLTELKHSVHFFHQIYQFYEEYLGASFPYSSYKQVFVEDTLLPSSSYATLSILNSHILHGPTIIDQTFDTRKIIAKALTNQWFGLYLSPKTWADAWLFLGLSGYLSLQFTKKHFGLNEYRYTLVKEEEYVCMVDNGAHPPLYHENYCQPTDMYSELAQRKSPLVIYMIEKKIGEDGIRKVLNSLLNISMSSLLSGNINVNNGMMVNGNQLMLGDGSSGELNGNSQSLTPLQNGANSNGGTNSNQNIETMVQTKKFIKLIKSMTGADLKTFSEKWIYGRGSPNLVCGFNFNRKKFMTEFALKQVLTRPEDKISGTLMIRIVELDGEFEQLINFEDDMFEYDFPCHSRCRKTKKKKLLSGDEEMEIDLSQKRETPLLWFRIDPELEWIHKITFRQPEYMWIHQLELDRDVIAQMEAIKGLKDYISFNSVRAVFKFIQNARYFYRVRCDAALLLSKLSTKETNFEGLYVLMTYFKSLFYDSDSNQLKPNNFKDFNSYFIQKSIPLSLSLIKDKEGRTPIESIEFLIELLKDNDNSLNTYSDCYYLESLLTSFSNVHTTNDLLIKKIKKQVSRYLKYDQLYPSYRNCVTIGCLKAYCQLFSIAKSKEQLDYSLFKEYSTYEHFEEVRKVALQCIYKLAYQFQCSPGTGSINDYFLDLFDNENTLMIKHFIIQMITTAPANVDERNYISMYKDDLRLIDRLWSYLNSKVTAFDIPLKVKIQKLYKLFWGKTTPSVFLRKLKSIKHSSTTIKFKPSGSSSSKRDSNSNNNMNNMNNSSSRRHSSSGSGTKKRKTPEELASSGIPGLPTNNNSEQPLKIHIKVGSQDIGSQSTIPHQPGLPQNSSSSHHYNHSSSSSSNSGGISLPSNNTRDHYHGHHHNNNNNSGHSHHSISELPESKQDIVKKLLEKDNDPDFKEFLEIQDKERKLREHRERNSKSRENRHSTDGSNGNCTSNNNNNNNISNNDVNNNNINNNEKDVSPPKDSNINTSTPTNQTPNDISPFKDKISSIIGSDNTTTSQPSRDKMLLDEIKMQAELDLDLENDLEFKKDLSLLEDIKVLAKEKRIGSSKSSRDHHRSSDYRKDRDRGDRDRGDRDRGDRDREHRDREHREKDHGGHSSSRGDKDRDREKEHRSEHRSGSGSTDKEHRSSSSSINSSAIVGDREKDHRSGVEKDHSRDHRNNSSVSSSSERSKDKDHRSGGDRDHRSGEKDHRSGGDRDRDRDHRSSNGGDRERGDREKDKDKEHRSDREKEKDREYRISNGNGGDRDKERDRDREHRVDRERGEHRISGDKERDRDREHRIKNSSSGGSGSEKEQKTHTIVPKDSINNSNNSTATKDIKINMGEKESPIKSIIAENNKPTTNSTSTTTASTNSSSDRPEREAKPSKRDSTDGHHKSDRQQRLSSSSVDTHINDKEKDSRRDHDNHHHNKRDGNSKVDKNHSSDSHRPFNPSSTINAGDTVGENMEVDILDDHPPVSNSSKSSDTTHKRMSIKIKNSNPSANHDNPSATSSSNSLSSSSSSLPLSSSTSSTTSSSSSSSQKKSKSSKNKSSKQQNQQQQNQQQHNQQQNQQQNQQNQQQNQQQQQHSTEEHSTEEHNVIAPSKSSKQESSSTTTATPTTAAPKLVFKIKSPFTFKPQAQTSNESAPPLEISSTPTTATTTATSNTPSSTKPEPKKLVLKIPMKK